MLTLTNAAAQVGCAPRVGALDSGSIAHGGVAIRTRVVRAKRLAALGNLAYIAGASRVLGIRDRRVAVGAADGSAEQRSCSVVVAVGVLARCAQRPFGIVLTFRSDTTYHMVLVFTGQQGEW